MGGGGSKTLEVGIKREGMLNLKKIGNCDAENKEKMV